MKSLIAFRVVIYFLVLSLVVIACGSFATPESCEAGGTADEVKFTELFTEMGLVNTETGQPAQRKDEGEDKFSVDDSVTLQVDSLTDVTIKVCVEERRGGGEIAFDQTIDINAGEGDLEIGTLKVGSYVVCVIVDGVLVKNLPFEVTR